MKEGFRTYLQNKGLLSLAIGRYIRVVNRFETYLENSNKSIEDVSTREIVSYFSQTKHTRGIANSTLERDLFGLKHYYSFLNESEEFHHPISQLKIQGTKTLALRKMLNSEQMDELIILYADHIKYFKPSPKQLLFDPYYPELLHRRYIALSLFCYQGISTSELLSLSRDNFDFANGVLLVPAHRTGAARNLPLRAKQMGKLIQFIDTNPKSILPNYSQIRSLAESLKALDPSFQSMHQLRISRIYSWIKTDGLRQAQHWAGHRSVVSTEKLLAGDIEELQNDINEFHPLST